MRYRSLIWLLIFYLGTPFFGKLLTAQDLTNPSPISVRFVGSILDADTQQPIAARVYLLDAEGNHLFVRSANEGGSAWPYAEQWVPMPQSVEQHTTVSAHPFTIDLPPGHYTIVVERGKEYLPHREVLHIAEQPVEQTFRLQRWSDMVAQGWYSGETHVHRRLAELPNVMAAEELNVAFPVTFWTTSSDQAPNLEPSALRSQGPSPFGPRVDMGADPIWINDSQVILPRNTEYEIFSIGSQRHTLDALFILNHRTPFTHTVPPIGPVVEQARREGALLDLDKHNWPWSLMLIEMSQVLGQTPAQIRQQILDFQLHEISPQDLRPTDRLAIMPYPGGRHPRRGFLDGAIAPQRDTKFSLFTPWSPSSYIVADVPEAIFSNLGLTYLAHTHIPTLWDLQGKTLPAQEWQRQEAGVLQSQRELPNGIRFDVRIEPLADHVRMELAVFNGTSETLTDLRVQHCLMLARATEFDQGSNDNKIFHGDYALVHDPHRTRWLITSWKPLGRAWGIPPVPCLHADPQLPDCEPGATTRAHEWLSFFEGEDWQAEVERIEALRWWEPATRE